MSENVSYKGFSGYQNMLIQMNTDLNQVAQVCETLKLEETRKAVLETAEGRGGGGQPGEEHGDQRPAGAGYSAPGYQTLLRVPEPGDL